MTARWMRRRKKMVPTTIHKRRRSFGHERLEDRSLLAAVQLLLSANEAAGTWELRASVEEGDNLGLAGFSADVVGEGGITVTASSADAPFGTNVSTAGGGPAGFFQNVVDGSPGPGQNITALQDTASTVAGRVILAVGQTAGTIDDASGDVDYAAPVLIASGTFTGESGVLRAVALTGGASVLPTGWTPGAVPVLADEYLGDTEEIDGDDDADGDDEAFLDDDPLNPGQQALFVFGTDGDDKIFIRPTPDNESAVVTIDREVRGIFALSDFVRFVITAKQGDDTVLVSNRLEQRSQIRLGVGDDKVLGGGGGDAILGATGDDLILARRGADAIFAGEGADRLDGGDDGDLLVTGTTDHDADEAAIHAILTAWNSLDPYEDRIDDLESGEGSTPELSTETVEDDGNLDVVYGRGGLDWFVFNLLTDDARDRTADEESLSAA